MATFLPSSIQIFDPYLCCVFGVWSLLAKLIVLQWILIFIMVDMFKSSFRSILYSFQVNLILMGHCIFGLLLLGLDGLLCCRGSLLLSLWLVRLFIVFMWFVVGAVLLFVDVEFRWASSVSSSIIGLPLHGWVVSLSFIWGLTRTCASLISLGTESTSFSVFIVHQCIDCFWMELMCVIVSVAVSLFRFRFFGLWYLFVFQFLITGFFWKNALGT